MKIIVWLDNNHKEGKKNLKPYLDRSRLFPLLSPHLSLLFNFQSSPKILNQISIFKLKESSSSRLAIVRAQEVPPSHERI